MIKPIYLKRIEQLKKEYSKIKTDIDNKQQIINECLDLKDILLKEIETITKNDKIEPNIKYIEIDSKLRNIESIVSKINSIYGSIQEKCKKVDKERNIIIDLCIEENPTISNDIITSKINNLLK